MGLDGYKVRGFRSDDLNKVMEINFECLPENYSSYFYNDLYQRFPKTFLVAVEDGGVHGYIMCRIERGFSKIHSFRPTRLCHIVSIAVREPYRRRGIASELIREAMRNGKDEYNASECFLEVRVSNKPAVNLYDKLGFANVKRNPRYYIDGEDAWVMARSIEDDFKGSYA